MYYSLTEPKERKTRESLSVSEAAYGEGLLSVVQKFPCTHAPTCLSRGPASAFTKTTSSFIPVRRSQNFTH